MSDTLTKEGAETISNRFEALEALREPFEAYLAEAQAVPVETQEQYEAAAFGLKKLKTWEKDITDYFEPERLRTYSAYNAVTTTKAAFLSKSTAVEKIIKGKMGAFITAENDRIRKAQIAAAQAEAEARRQIAASMPTPEAPATVPEVVIPPVPEPTRIAGISVTNTFGFRILDPSKISPEFLIPDESKILKVVKTMGKSAASVIGGIEVYEETKIGSGRG